MDVQDFKHRNVMTGFLQDCNFSLPVWVAFNNNLDIRNEDWDNATHMLLHEFELEFSQRLPGQMCHHPIGKGCVIEWFAKVLQNVEEGVVDKEYLSRISVDCIRFCAEIPGVGIFHSMCDLWKALYGTDFWFEYDRSNWITPNPELAMAMRLHPFARIGKRVFHIECGVHQVDESWQGSIFHFHLRNRLM